MLELGVSELNLLMTLNYLLFARGRI
jgi:hypothetical protein